LHVLRNAALDKWGALQVFCRNNRSGIGLIYFSSEGEVSFCGHGTIACMYSLIRETPELSSLSEITIQTKRKGIVAVYNELATQDAIYVSATGCTYSARIWKALIVKRFSSPGI